MATDRVTDNYDQDEQTVPRCPACTVYAENWLPMEIYQIGALAVDEQQPFLLEGFVALCRNCKFTVPLTLIPDPTHPRYTARQACGKYQGVCKTCHRPPGEHPDV